MSSTNYPDKILDEYGFNIKLGSIPANNLEDFDMNKFNLRTWQAFSAVA
jgi:hypothetical protein